MKRIILATFIVLILSTFVIGDMGSMWKRDGSTIYPGGGRTVSIVKDTGGTFDATTVASIFGDSTAGQGDSTYITGNTISASYGHDVDTGTLGVNYRGYLGGVTRFRDTVIYDGKGTAVTTFDGSSGYVGIGESSPQGDLHISTDSAHGGYIIKTFSATSGTLTGATDKIELNIPAAWRILQCQLHVKVAVTNAGDNTWSSELNDGAQEEVISAGSAETKNTNVNHFADGDTWGTLTNAETDILLTPQGADFTAGEIEAHCIAIGFNAWDAD